jgi:hypothetical protein
MRYAEAVLAAGLLLMAIALAFWVAGALRPGLFMPGVYLMALGMLAAAAGAAMCTFTPPGEP